MSGKRKLLTGLVAILTGLIIGAIVILITGKNPITAYVSLFSGAFSSISRIGDVFLVATTLILTGLAAAFAFRTGLFNIGIAGQMFVAGYVAVFITHYFKMPAPFSQIVAVLGALVAGALWAFIPGFLKAFFNVNEVVSTIMMNWIGYWLVYYGIGFKFLLATYVTETAPMADQYMLRVDWLRNLFGGSYVNLGIFISLIAAVVIWFLLEKTTFGFELKAVGFNRHAAEYAGVKVKRNLVLSMMISGALAGLAGAVFYLGATNVLQISALPRQGMEGIAVALIGSNSPFGVILSSLFLSVIETGKGFMSASLDIPKEITDLITATIIYCSAISLFVNQLLDKMKIKRQLKAKKVGEANA